MAGLFRPVATEQAYIPQKIVSQIRGLILNGRLKAGDKLPPVPKLAKSFNVSRNSVREAIIVLTTMGLVEIKTGQGVFIKEITLDSIDSLLDDVADLLVLRQDQMKEILEIRKLLEPQAAAWAAKRANVEEIDELSRLANTYDDKFHAAIMRASHNEILEKIILSILDNLAQAYTNTTILSNLKEKYVNDHKEIALAISRRDSEKARHLMHEHISSMEKNIACW